MDRQDDNSADGCDPAIVPVTGRSLPPVGRRPAASDAAFPPSGPMRGHEGHPLPLTPAAYSLAERPFARPSVSATLPPAMLSAPDAEAVPQLESALPQPIEPAVPVHGFEPASHSVPDARSDPPSQHAPAPTEIIDEARVADMAEWSSPVVSVPAPSTFNIGAMAEDRPHAPLAIDPVRRPGVYDFPSSAPRWPDIATLTQYAKIGLKIAGFFAAGWLALIVVLIFVYRFVNPPMSSLMLQQTLSGESLTQTWVSIEDISPQVVRAVLLSEDGRFCQHSGVDFDAMQDAIERAGEGPPRGASTISMQVTKNLFLWPSKSYIRKAIEIPLTWAIELVWPKRRIMEVYLNIAEWGPGIFGVEAASRFHFQKAASRLNEREAAQLAVALPNPYIRDAGDPGPKTRRLASDIQARMRNAYASQTACVLGKAAKGR